MIEIDRNIWLVDGPNVSFYGFAYPTRMVVVRLATGAVWVWSPIALTEALRAEIDLLGPVAHLVSPNKLHHLYLADWQAAFPTAKLWGPATTIKKKPELTFQPPLTGEAPEAWAEEIAQFHFCGSSFMDEVVFCHLPSRTAIFADLSENFSDSFIRAYWSWWQRPIARLWKIVEPYGYAPLEWRWSWREKVEDRRTLKRLLALKPERVVMAHGTWQRSGGTAYLERALRWLL
ncbi:MAG: DUF4336 domain-containing protein [Rhodospirillaceae bacterium]|nr:DUF4336 domain-containing protein [Rhodospirillaceae bacterium]